jgi:hypothetical protein
VRSFIQRYWLAAAVLAAFVGVFIVLVPVMTGRDATRDHSSLRKNAFGCAALAELCASAEPPLRVHRITRSLEDLSDVDGLLLIIDPEEPFDDAEIDELIRWVEEGGTLIVAFEGLWDDPSAARPGSGLTYVQLAAALGLRIADRGESGGPVVPPPTSPLATGVQRVAAGTRYAVEALSGQEAAARWASAEAVPTEVECVLPHDPRDLTPHLVSGGRTILVSFRHGRGKVYASSDAEMFANATLAREDNVVFIANLLWGNAPERVIYFDEYHHGFGARVRAASDVDPAPLRRAIGVAIAGCVLFLIGKAIRFGAPTPVYDARRRSAVEYVQAMAGLWHGARAYHWALEQIADAFRHRIARAAGLPPTVSTESLVAALAERRGVARGDTVALLQDLEEALSGEPLNESRLTRLARRITALEEAAAAPGRAANPGGRTGRDVN